MPVSGHGVDANLEPPPPAIEPAWSPVAHFGGYLTCAQVGGLEQAVAVAEVGAAADEQAQWRQRRGEPLRPSVGYTGDPCFQA